MKKQVLIELAPDLYAALEALASEDRRSMDQYISVTLHRHCFGMPGRATDEEVAAYRAARAGKSRRVNLKAKDRNRLFERDEGKCRHCSGTILYDEPWHIDHLVPLTKGGTNDLSNLALSCVRCNLEKGAK